MKSKTPILDSELIINPDGSIYHLALKPGEVAKTIITVGDPNRVDSVTKHFDSIRLERTRREFKTVTGTMGGKEITVISTGIGTDNIDIVFNELDALFNVDFETKLIKDELVALDFIRLGTSGCLQGDIDIDTILISKMAVGLEGLMSFYQYNESEVESSVSSAVKRALDLEFTPKTISASNDLVNYFGKNFIQGITCTASGFYAPQGRSIRLENAIDQLTEKLSAVHIGNNKITNLEMETAGIYGLAKILGHRAISINALLANRANGEFSADPTGTVENMIKTCLELMVSNEYPD